MFWSFFSHPTLTIRWILCINFGFTLTLMCVVALYTQYIPEFCGGKNHRREIWTHDLCQSRAVSYQIDHRESYVLAAVPQQFNKRRPFSFRRKCRQPYWTRRKSVTCLAHNGSAYRKQNKNRRFWKQPSLFHGLAILFWLLHLRTPRYYTRHFTPTQLAQKFGACTYAKNGDRKHRIRR